MLSYVWTGNVTYIGLSVMTKCVHIYSKIREIKTHLSQNLGKCYFRLGMFRDSEKMFKVIRNLNFF